MKSIITTILLVISLNAMAQMGKAVTEKKTFKRVTTVSQMINAEPSVVWSILTDAADFARWNSTVISIDGEIVEGEKIRLKSTLDPKRTFKLKVKDVVPNQSMLWCDTMGERRYTLEAKDGGTLFTMRERIGGPLFPLFASKIPSFDESFEQFAADLKKEVESKSK